MINSKNLLLGLLAAGFVVTSCNKKGCTDEIADNYNSEASKDDGSCSYTADPPGPPVETFADIDAFFNANTVTAENFTVDAAMGGTFTTTAGSVITIPANAFIAQSGTAITGTVNIKMKEIFTTNQIIYSGVYPVSWDTQLNSGGEFFLEASQSGSALRVADGEFLTVEIPAQAEDPNMELFLAGGVEDDLDSINWAPADSTFTDSGFTFSSVDDTYTLSLDSLGWANIDAFMNSITYFDCYFNLTGVSGLNNSNTTAFSVFKNENAVWPVGVNSWGDITSNLITESHLGAIDLNLVVISVVGSQLYYGLLDVTPASMMTYDVAMTAVTAADLDAIILALE